MPSHDGVGPHDDQCLAPVRPRLGEQYPEDAIARAELRTFAGTPQCGQLLTERQVLKGDASMSGTEKPERSE